MFLCSLDVRQEHGEIKVISSPGEAGKPAPLFFLLFTSQSLGSSVLLKQGEWYSIVINTVLSFSVIKRKYPVEQETRLFWHISASVRMLHKYYVCDHTTKKIKKAKLSVSSYI